MTQLHIARIGLSLHRLLTLTISRTCLDKTLAVSWAKFYERFRKISLHEPIQLEHEIFIRLRARDILTRLALGTGLAKNFN